MDVPILTSHSELDATARAAGEEVSVAQDTGSIRPGRYAVPVIGAQEQDAGCLSSLNESVAWQCASSTIFQLNISPSTLSSTTNSITLSSPSSFNGIFYHGHQAPEVQNVELEYAVSKEVGPMYRFSATYDHVVLLKEEDFIISKRPVLEHPVLQDGDNLWQCVFTGTSLDGYVYINKKMIASRDLNGTEAMLQMPMRLPYVLKLAETRTPNGDRPYCEKMKVQNGALTRVLGEGITLGLADSSTEAETDKVELTKSAKFRLRQQAPGSQVCRCQWMIN